MADIIGFTPKPKDSDYIWRCECGCLSFTLKADMTAECQNCGAIPYDENGSWRGQLPEPDLSAPDCEPDDFRVTDMSTSGAALNRTLGRASAETTAFVIVAQNDGALSVWGEPIKTDDERGWFDRRLTQARKLLVKD